jgi:5-oxoprolinase (ATP-hydrolysing) subunit A
MGPTIAPPQVEFMPDTGDMPKVDLNADLGESDSVLPSDLAILDQVTSANVACGFHAGSRSVMEGTCRAALERGVAVGAHVSYRDRDGFGRRALDIPNGQLLADIVEQCVILSEVLESLGGTVSYVKPHGALYHRMGVDREVASAVVAAVRDSDIPVVVAQAGTLVVELAQRSGVGVAREAFADRAYRADGTLVPRDRPGSVIDSPDEVARRGVSLVVDGGIETDDGSWLAVECDSLCVHGDTPGAAVAASATRAALEAAGVTVGSFIPTSGRTPT